MAALLRLGRLCRQHRRLVSGARLLSASSQVEELVSHPKEDTRNFCIIAHIDHGKSTLADRLLELTGHIREGGESQVLDSLDVERERGITVKAATASMRYKDPQTQKSYLLNLIDTPGHVDFSHEVTRSLAACQGALLLVDSSQGVQAQTLATYHAAAAAGITLIPVLTKLDLPHADPDRAVAEMRDAFGIDPDTVLLSSAKTGDGIEDILSAIVATVPAPGGDHAAPFRGLVFDSWFDQYKGAVAVTAVVDGEVQRGDKVSLHYGETRTEVQEVGLLLPSPQPVEKLQSGQVGYIMANVKAARDLVVGDTISTAAVQVEPITSLDPATPVVFGSVYPLDSADFDALSRALARLMLNDASVTARKESNGALGTGFRCGFLGLLHMEVFFDRLDREYNLDTINTAPMVPYHALLPPSGERLEIETPDDWPAHLLTGGSVVRRAKGQGGGGGGGVRLFEPMVTATVVTPVTSLGGVLELLQQRRGTQQNMQYLPGDRVALTYLLPWQQVVTDMYDRLKSITAGYATFDYTEAEPQESDLVRVDMLLNGSVVSALSFITHRSAAEAEGRAVAGRLKTLIPRQQFEVNIQASVGTKVFAKERIRAYRKDVLTKNSKSVGGGDITRKRKLLEKQKRGKRRMKSVGNVSISQEAFLSVMKR